MKNKTTSRDRKFSRPYMLLSSPILSRSIPDGAYLSLIGDFLADAPNEGFEQALQKLLRIPRFRSRFSGEITDIRQAAIDGISIGGMPLLRAWQLAVFSIKTNNEKLNLFDLYRDDVESKMLCGEYDSALNLLNDGYVKFGESLWYVRTKLLLLSELKRTEELISYSDKLQAGAEKTLIFSVLHFSRVVTDSDSPLTVLDKLVSSASNELRQTRYEDFASLLELLFTPQPLIASREYWPAITLLHAFPVIDQYVIIEKILALAIISDSISPLGDIHDKIQDLVVTTNLPAFRRLNFKNNGMGKNECFDSELLLSYEEGRYADVIYYFNKNFKHLRSPLAYVNMVAKSYSHVEGAAVLPTVSAPILHKIIKNLQNIYSMGSTANNSEETLKSLAVRYNCMRWLAQLQLSVYKALPWRYETKNRNSAVMLSSIFSDAITPLSTMLIMAKEFMYENLPDYPLTKVPTYRILKKKCVDLIREAPLSIETEKAVYDYIKIEPRHKDRIEVLALYLIKSEQHQNLLAMAAAELIDCATAYLVIPMEQLIRLIEENAYANRHAVIICFYYHRYVAQDKDYVLNETLDDYLIQNNVDRPSRLLQSAQDVDKLDAIFYRDICIPEILDYLSSFSTIQELFAERIKILDELSERELIGSDARSAEVEEIISRVIIDAATTNLNGAKISVDESALRKKLRIDVANLLEIFHQTQDNNDDRFTVTADQTVNGKAHGYLSGARNALVLRLCNLVMESFMFDEKFGLDKTLSGEIRHGFFSNLMHSKLEEKKLLAETDADGNYRPNQHWREINHLVNISSMVEIEKIINHFGEKLNLLVAEAEGWMKIKNGPDGASGYIGHDLPKDDFDKVRRFVENSHDAEAVCNYIFSILWKRIEFSLARIREKINSEFRERVDALFQDLEINLVNLKRHVALVELMTAIAQVRNGIREDISTVAEWFRRAELNEIKAGTLEKAIAIAINSFERVKGAIFGIKTNFEGDFQYVKIDDSAVKPFILAFVNLLDNSYRHSGLWSRTQVRISGKIEGEMAIIRISNDLSSEKAENLSFEILSAIRSKISNADSINLIRTEGGSGLVKAFNGISSLGTNKTLDVDCTDHEFTAIVYYGT